MRILYVYFFYKKNFFLSETLYNLNRYVFNKNITRFQVSKKLPEARKKTIFFITLFVSTIYFFKDDTFL